MITRIPKTHMYILLIALVACQPYMRRKITAQNLLDSLPLRNADVYFDVLQRSVRRAKRAPSAEAFACVRVAAENFASLSADVERVAQVVAEIAPSDLPDKTGFRDFAEAVRKGIRMVKELFAEAQQIDFGQENAETQNIKTALMNILKSQQILAFALYRIKGEAIPDDVLTALPFYGLTPTGFLPVFAVVAFFAIAILKHFTL